uniref:Uncharacterized protein n=1 Tax=Amphimedon queenslandica TaxID=400682 RepID=A0A1X7VNF8_AMPQE
MITSTRHLKNSNSKCITLASLGGMHHIINIGIIVVIIIIIIMIVIMIIIITSDKSIGMIIIIRMMII